MAPAAEPEKIPLPRILLGLGFFLIIAAVGVGAALKGTSAIPKFLALAGVISAVVGGIGSALVGKRHQGA